MTIYHNDIQTGSLDSGISHCDVQFGSDYGSAYSMELSQSSAQSPAYFGEAPNNFGCTYVSSGWKHIEFKGTTSDSLGDGYLIAWVYILTGGVYSMTMTGGYAHDPDLSGTATADYTNLTAGNLYDIKGSSDYTFQTGYFDIAVSCYYDPHCVFTAKITKLQWVKTATPTTTYDLWEEDADYITGICHSCVRFGN